VGDLRRAFASSVAANVSSRLMRNRFEAVSRQPLSGLSTNQTWILQCLCRLNRDRNNSISPL
jgi:hypothetical protein